MIQNLLSNFRTTSAGLITIAGAIVNLVFAIKNHVDDQGTWMIAITQTVTGLGLMFSRDQAASRIDKEDTKSKIAELQLRSNIVPNAIESGDTSQLRNVPITPVSVPTPVVPPKAPVSITLPQP